MITSDNDTFYLKCKLFFYNHLKNNIIIYNVIIIIIFNTNIIYFVNNNIYLVNNICFAVAGE